MVWDPADYLRFADHRLRPALDLLARVPVESPASVFDLGCGTGNVTRLLAGRWPDAEMVGVDSSEEMLAAARQGDGAISWLRADLASWTPPRPAGLLFSNAALHWLDDHASLFPRLAQQLAPGGVLAVQMPRNHGAPSHTCLTEAALGGPWRDRLAPLLRPAPVAAPPIYYDVLAPHVVGLDIWETEYLQVLTGEDAVLRWTRSTALAPLAAALDGDQRSAFVADYAARLRRAYPQRPDGTTLFPFRRLFVVARRG